MKRALLIIICLLFTAGAFAMSETAKSKIAAQREIYRSNQKVLDGELNGFRAEYEKIAADTTISEKTRKTKLKKAERQIRYVKNKKKKLREQYVKDKKAIKKKYR